MRGKFITLEGIDGAGKSTHLAWLAEFLRRQGKDVVSTREPGGTPLGEKLRALLLSEDMHPETETLLMFAARKEHVVKVIEPALAAGKWVMSDRFSDASYAYQGGGRGLATEKVATLEDWTLAGFRPDLTLLFDLPTATAGMRLAGTGQAPDRFELEAGGFFERVRQAYLDRARQEPRRIMIVDSTNNIEDIHRILEIRLLSIC